MVVLQVSARGDIKLADLGLAKSTQFINRTICGTPLYMAPEVLEGKQHNEKADLFGFASIMWELWYGTCIIKKYQVCGSV